MRRRTVLVLCVVGLFVAACGPIPEPKTSVDDPVVPVIEGSTDRRVQTIADTLNYEADISTDPGRAAIRVTYAEKVNHSGAQQQPNYGIHYIVTIAADAGDTYDLDIAKEVAGTLFMLTTQHVISVNPLVSHMGVEIIEPDAWFVGGHERGGIRFWVRARASLEEVANQPNATLDMYLGSDGDRISGRWLQDLLNELARLRNP